METSNTKGIIPFRVNDLFGRLMIEKDYGDGDNEANLYIRNLHEGYYFVSLTQNNRIIQHGKFLRRT